MSSIDWQRLVDEHDSAPERESDEWIEALMAMDEDPAERLAAEEADPLLMFRRLPSPEVTGSDIESMKAAVKVMREVSETLAENTPAEPRSRRLARWAMPLAALLVLALTAVLLGGLSSEVNEPVSSTKVASLSGPELPVSEFASTGMLPARFVSAAGDVAEPAMDFQIQIETVASLAAFDLPLVEDSDPGSDLLMQIENDDLSLVVVLTGQDV